MESILQEIYAQVCRDLGSNPDSLDQLGAPSAQLKAVLEECLEVVRADQPYDPFQLTNRVLMAMDRQRRFRA